MAMVGKKVLNKRIREANIKLIIVRDETYYCGDEDVDDVLWEWVRDINQHLTALTRVYQ